MNHNGPTTNKSVTHRTLLAVCTLIVVGYFLVTPPAPLAKAHLIGYAICHQMPAHSFHPGGRQLPLCARCTGTYIGVSVSMAMLIVSRRLRAGEMLERWMLLGMVAFIAVMGIDGINSYLTLFDSLPHLYAPRNWLRAATGSLNGIALTMIVWPIFNFTLWKSPQRVRPLNTWWELLGLLAADAAVVAVVQAEPPWSLYPVALLTTAGVLWMLTLVNTMILLIVFRRDGRAERWRDVVLPMLCGLVMTLIELTAMGTFRYLLTGTLYWPGAT